MIKTLHGMHKRPDLSIEDLHHHWFEDHGPIVATAPRMVRYVQNITVPESYGGSPAPTHEGASMTWFESLDDFWYSVDSGGWQVQKDDAPNWFDMAAPEGHSVAIEHPIVDGTTHSVMVKAILLVARAPELSLEEFQRRWLDEHGRLGAALPGLRRYVQNHALAEAYGHAGWPLSHDGWSELWFDDLPTLQAAFASSQAQALTGDGHGLFDSSKSGIVIARERPVVVEPR